MVIFDFEFQKRCGMNNQNCHLATIIVLVLTFVLSIQLSPAMQPLPLDNPYHPVISNPVSEPWRWLLMENISSRGVRSLEDDTKGNMWFGVDRGIIKYDGYTWEVFDSEPWLQRPTTHIKSFDDGRLYAGNESGLLEFVGQEWKKIFPSDQSIDIPVTYIMAAPDGSLMAGIENGIFQKSATTSTIFTVLSEKNQLRLAHPDANIVILPDEILFQRSFGRVDDIFFFDDQQVWIFMSRHNSGKVLQFSLADTVGGVIYKYNLLTDLGGHKLSNRSQALRTKDNKIWIIDGFYKSGILQYDGKRWEQFKLSDKFGGDELYTCIDENSDGSVWIGGLGRLLIYKNGDWDIFTSPTLPVPSSRIIIHESRNGRVWIAGLQGDVFQIQYSTEHWIKYKGLNFQFQDQNGNNWFISRDSRIVVEHHGRMYYYDSGDGLIDAPVRIVETAKGTIWAAGSHQGKAATAQLGKDMRWTIFTHPTLSWGIDPRSVFQCRDGNLWFGASVDRQDALGQVSGVLLLKNPDEGYPKWIHFTDRDGISQHNAYGIGQSSDGSIWLGGTDLLRFDGDSWSPIYYHEFFNEFVDIVHSREKLWVGSRHYGLFSYDGKDWMHYTKEHGLPSNTIISVFEENPESIWVVTDKGIAWSDGNLWFSGLFSDDFNIPREGGEIISAPDGSIWINKSLREWKRRAFPYSTSPPEATREFWTIRYNRDNNPPKTTIDVYTKRVSPAGNTLISWNGNDFWEETPSQYLTYSWRMNGGQWSDFTHNTFLTHTNLKSGDYTFEVRSRDLAGNIESLPAIIQFTVIPPVWRQAWFIILVISFILIVGYYEIRLINRNRMLFNLNASLSETHKDLEYKHNKINLQKEKIIQQKEELEKKTKILEERSQEILKQRDQLQEMLQKMEELSHVKQRFFTNISHEFRTPLTLILGSIEYLLKRHKENENGNPRLNQAYETIQRSSRRILRLINQILEVRKIETGKLELHLDGGDIVSFAREIVRLFNDMALNHGILLKFKSNLNSIHVMFDHDKIEKVLFNLLSNAFKSTPHGGTICVSIKKIKKLNAYTDIADNGTDTHPDGECWLEFAVKDTGKGIPADELKQVFERFYQVKDTTVSAKFDGSGIGLSYVKDLIVNHNGDITVKSEPGKGSIFTFVLPCIPAPVSTEGESIIKNYNPEQFISKEMRLELIDMNRKFEISKSQTIESNVRQTTAVKSNNGKLLIMLVEDEFELRRFIREYLETDFDIIEAGNGAEGYEMATEYQPDVIISDVMMPIMNGIELSTKLKANLVTNHIPIILLTARVAYENKLEGYHIGADGYIEKPFTLEYLRVRVNNLIAAKEKTKEKVLRDLITLPSELTYVSEDHKLQQKMREVLEENISNPDFDVESLSQEFCLSRFHFSRKIKQLTGLTPKEILDSFRLKRAEQILQQNKLSISEIAYMVGFDHPNTFTRAFKKYYNITPSEFASQNPLGSN